MDKWEDKSNNEILIATKQMQQEHENVKAEILKLVTKMENIEKNFSEANKILNKRLKGEIE